MEDSTNKLFWQRMAKLYAPFMKSTGPLYERICEHCRTYITPEMDVLELACGTGQLSFRLAASSRHWEATDFSETMVAEAEKQPRPANLSFAVRDATHLPYPDSSFDAVLIANALHIMPEPERAIFEIHRVLKPDGVLLAPTFIWGDDSRQNLSAWLMEQVGFHVFHRWRADEFSDFARTHGFNVLEQALMGGSIRPLCCLIARKSPGLISLPDPDL